MDEDEVEPIPNAPNCPECGWPTVDITDETTDKQTGWFCGNCTWETTLDK